MRKHLLAAALLASLAGCQNSDAPTTPPASTEQAGQSQADAQFAELSKKALDTWMQLSPVSATQIGDHRFDSELDDLSAAGQNRHRAFGMERGYLGLGGIGPIGGRTGMGAIPCAEQAMLDSLHVPF